jgi:hypothetical protein
MQTPRMKAPPRDRMAVPSGAAAEGSATSRWATLALLFLADAVLDEPSGPCPRSRAGVSGVSLDVRIERAGAWCCCCYEEEEEGEEGEKGSRRHGDC